MRRPCRTGCRRRSASASPSRPTSPRTSRGPCSRCSSRTASPSPAGDSPPTQPCSACRPAAWSRRPPGTRARRRTPPPTPTCASSSDLLLGDSHFVCVLVAPADVDACAGLDARAVVLPDDREPVAGIGVDEDAREGTDEDHVGDGRCFAGAVELDPLRAHRDAPPAALEDRKSTRLNSSHSQISYAVFCLKK